MIDKDGDYCTQSPTPEYPGIYYGNVDNTPWFVPLLIDLARYRERFFDESQRHEQTRREFSEIRNTQGDSDARYKYIRAAVIKIAEDLGFESAQLSNDVRLVETITSEIKLNEKIDSDSYTTLFDGLCEIGQSMGLDHDYIYDLEDAHLVKAVIEALRSADERIERELSQLQDECNALRAQLQAQGAPVAPSVLSPEDLAKLQDSPGVVGNRFDTIITDEVENDLRIFVEDSEGGVQ